MSPVDPTQGPADEPNTRQFLDQTIGAGDQDSEEAKTVDPDATLHTDSADGEASASFTLASHSEKIGDRIGPYHLNSELGTGGMGTVYMAEQTEPVTRRVALKIIKAGMDTGQVIARFEAERQALSMMEHPNIALVLDAGATDAGRPYFVMELVEGQPVTVFCDKQQLDVEQRLQLFIHICDAIQHAHQKGIIHRDIKPSNILVAMRNGKPVAKVIDFGVAKATNQRLTEKTMYTQQGQIVGTLEYMSPEQAQMTEENVDTRSDIYSLGVLLYELLTGSTPLTRQTLSNAGYLDILARIRDDEAPKPSSRLTDSSGKLQGIADARGVEPRKLTSMLRGDLDWIVLKALDKDPGRRYETAAGLADDVERFINSEPIIARPPTGVYLLKKFARRHRTGVIAGTVVLLTMIAGITIATWQAFRARDAERTVAQQMVELKQKYDLEQEYAQLAQQRMRENETQKATLHSEITYLTDHGQWRDALRRMADYETTFGDLPLELLIKRLAAYGGLSKVEQLQDEIEVLEKHPEAPQFRSQLLLWRGYAFLSDKRQQVDAESLIQQAIEGNLSTEDRLFAEGLIAESLDEAVDKFKSALEIAPFHPQARMQLVVTLTLLGRYDDVQEQVEYGKTLFVDDPRYYFADSVSHSLANNYADSQEVVGDIRVRFPRSNTNNIRAVNRVSRAVNRQFRVYDESGLLDWIPIIRQGLPMFQQRSYEAIPVPEFQKVKIFTAYGEFAQSFLNPLMAIARPRKKHQLIIGNCQKAWLRHPDALFKCFEAWSWFALGNYEQSTAAFELAATSDGLFPEIRNQAMYGAFLSRVKQCEKDADMKKIGDAVDYLEKYIELDFESHRALPMFRASCMAGRWDLARHICDTMISKGDPPQKWYPLLIDEAVDRENAALALVTCEELMELMPNDPQCEARHEEIVEIIVRQGEEQ